MNDVFVLLFSDSAAVFFVFEESGGPPVLFGKLEAPTTNSLAGIRMATTSQSTRRKLSLLKLEAGEKEPNEAALQSYTKRTSDEEQLCLYTQRKIKFVLLLNKY